MIVRRRGQGRERVEMSVDVSGGTSRSRPALLKSTIYFLSSLSISSMGFTRARQFLLHSLNACW
jgi:hypothetical protein